MSDVKEKLIALVGKTIRFTKAIEAHEMYAEEGMRAVVTKYYFDDRLGDPVHRLYIDYSRYEEENHKRQNANYYDGNGVPCLTAVEAGYYEPLDHIYLDGPEAWPFEVVEEANG